MADDKKNIPDVAPPTEAIRSRGRSRYCAGAACSRACAD